MQTAFQIVILVGMGGIYWLVGTALALPWGAKRNHCAPNAAQSLVVGFAAAPLLLGWLAFVCGGRLGFALLVLVGLAVMALIVWWLPHKSSSSMNGGRLEILESIQSRFWVWGVGIAVALLVNSGYLLWSLALKDSAGHQFIGTNTFDFEKHMGMVTALMAYGLPAQHPVAPGVPLLYYLGFYTVPASVASLWPAAVLKTLVAQFFITPVVIAVLVTTIVSETVSPRPIWHAAGLVIVFSGLSLGAGLFPDTAMVWPVLAKLWHQPLHIEPVLNMLAWLPQHAIAIVYAIWSLIYADRITHLGMGNQLVWVLLSAFVIASSALIGFLYLLALLLWVGYRLLRKTERTTHRTWQSTERSTVIVEPALPSPLKIVILGLTVGIVLMPYYFSVVLAAIMGHLPVSSVLRPTEDLLYNFGTATAASGVGVVSLIAAPFIMCRRRTSHLVPVWGMLVVAYAMSLLLSRVSELEFMSLYTLQIGLPSLSLGLVLALFDGEQMRQRDWKVVTTIITAFIAVTLSAIYGIYQIRTQIRYVPRGSSDELALMNWVQRFTPGPSVVSVVEADRTTFDYRLGRVGAQSGTGMFSRLEDRWGDTVALAEYRRANSFTLHGVVASDYVVLPKVPIHRFSVENRPVPPTAKISNTLERLGFITVFENASGIVFLNKHVGKSVDDDLLRLANVQEAESIIVSARQQVNEKKYLAALTMLEPYAADPSLAEAQYLLAFSLHMENRLAEALPHYDAAMAAGFSEFWVRYNRGALKLELGDRAGALQDLQRAHELDPSHEGVQSFLSKLSAP